MKRALLIIPLLLLMIAGCGTPLKEHWYDFTAYYNTFYNANRYFEAGLEMNRSEREEINPHELIRIHPPPSQAGGSEFEVAIEKSSDILRQHSRSNYVDDALELIGISFFYRQEYFVAQEKFRELFNSTADPAKIESSIIWEGRTYLELELYSQGIRLLETGIADHEHWTPGRLAEARTVLAQLYAYRGHTYNAANQLLIALEDLEGDELRSRAYFHYGQLMESMDNLQQASFAFSRIREIRSSFDIEYNARLKEIQILRKRGHLDEAAAELRDMERGDKFFEYRLPLFYELANTERERGNSGKAEELFNRVLHTRSEAAEQDLLAKSYYGLAEVYRYNYVDYQTAAAYYDSAASVNVDVRLLPGDWEADQLAHAFGEYALVKQEITRLDSLLVLGKMPQDEFDRKIEEIKNRRMQELAEQQRETERRDERGADIDMEEELEVTTEVGMYGFLNVENRRERERSSLRFREIWGERPLADNWRRGAAITATIRELEEQQVVVHPEEVLTQEEGHVLGETVLDFSEIPFEPAAQDSFQVLIYRNYYQLGQIYLTILSMPDSAASHFERVYRDGPEDSPKDLALYALADIALQRGDEEQGLHWAEKLIEEFPASNPARRMAGRTGLPLPALEMEGNDPDEIDDQGPLLPLNTPDRVDPQTNPGKWIEMAGQAGSDEQQAGFLLDVALQYIRTARSDTFYSERQSTWQRIEEHSQEDPALSSLLEGSADSLAVDEDSGDFFKTVEENTAGMEEPATVDDDADHRQENGMHMGRDDGEPWTQERLSSLFPYRGVYWDRARTLLWEVKSSWPESPAAARAESLLGELDGYSHLHGQSRPGAGSLPGEGGLHRDDEPPTCEELNLEPEVIGGKPSFLDKVIYPQWVEEITLLGELEYEVVITASGQLQDYQQMDRFSRTGVPQAVEQAMDEYLQFEPLELGPQTSSVRCTIMFDIEL